MIHLYGFVEDEVDLGDLTGIDGVELRLVPIVDGLRAVASDHRQAPAPARDVALSHHEVITAVGERVAVLPARFGAAFEDAEVLRTAIEPQATALRERLGEVGQRREYVIRPRQRPTVAPAAASTSSSTPPASGREYLEGRLAVARETDRVTAQAAADLAEVDVVLAPLAARAIERSGPAGLERCYLVDRDQEARFEAAADEAMEGRPTELLLGGPLPPYTFAASEGGGT